MKLRELRETAQDVAAIPQKINLIVALSFVAMLVSCMALILSAVRHAA